MRVLILLALSVCVASGCSYPTIFPEPVPPMENGSVLEAVPTLWREYDENTELSYVYAASKRWNFERTDVISAVERRELLFVVGYRYTDDERSAKYHCAKLLASVYQEHLGNDTWSALHLEPVYDAQGGLIRDQGNEVCDTLAKDAATLTAGSTGIVMHNSRTE